MSDNRSHILIIDDTLDMDLARQNLPSPRFIFGTGINDPRVVYVHDQAGALQQLKYWKEDGIRVDTVLCDYKLRGESGRDEWGTDTLRIISELPNDLRPESLFLMSKSGFRQEDASALEAIGAQYFHAYELYYAAADTVRDERQKQVTSQRATTNVFRKWCNENLGKNYALEKYISPNVAEAERGSLPFDEVIRRGGQDHEQLDRLDETSLRRLLQPHVVNNAVDPQKIMAIGKGIEGPSVAGHLAFSQADIDAIHRKHPGDSIVLVLAREYVASDNNVLLAPENNIRGMVLLDKGTQHIAVLAENRSIPVIFANREKYPEFEVRGQQLVAYDQLIERGVFATAGDWLTLDGQTLTVLAGKHDIVAPSVEELARVEAFAHQAYGNAMMTWHVADADDMVGMRVLANADNAQDVANAKSLGAAGIGLVRTEHMFLEAQAMACLQDAMLAEDWEKKRPALEKLEALQMEALSAVFANAAPDLSVKVRLLDAPPREFLPAPEQADAIQTIANRLGMESSDVATHIGKIFQENLRGAAFGCEHRDVYYAQLSAIFTAAKANHAKPEIMVPLVRNQRELDTIRELVSRAAQAHGMEGRYKFGVMLETKEAVADPDYDLRKQFQCHIVDQCDFVSFGSNDLTEEMLGIPRGDYAAMEAWQQDNRIPHNPFNALVGDVQSAIAGAASQLLTYAKDKGKPFEIGLCGRHATDRSTVEFCQEQRFDSLSVPPTREGIYQGMVEAGRTACLTATRERERRDASLRQKQAITASIVQGNLPEGVQITGERIIEHASTVLVMVEDDDYQRDDILQDLAEKPVVLCSSANQALNAIAALRAQGKKTLLVTDANVPISDSKELNPALWHPLAVQLREEQRALDRQVKRAPLGVLLANRVASGTAFGMEAADVRLFTAGANMDHLDKGIVCQSKSSYLEGDHQKIADFIDTRTQAHRGPMAEPRPKPAKIVLYVDDEAVFRALFATGFQRAFLNRVEFAHSAEEALDKVREGGVSLLLTDHLMPGGMSGGELVDTLKGQNTELSMAIITNSGDMLKNTHHNGVPVFSKEHLIDLGTNFKNPLRKFIAEALGVDMGAALPGH